MDDTIKSMRNTKKKKKGFSMPWKRAAESGPDEVQDEQQQQLLLLFEKRNQLKREFGKTLNELETLREQHTALLERASESESRLAGLETTLRDPERAQNVIIYYRLDALWKFCRKVIEKRRAELVEKFETLEKQKALDNFKKTAVQQQQQLEGKFSQLDGVYQEMSANLKQLQDELRRSQKIWHYFKRKKLLPQLAEAEAQIAPIASQREECLAELQRVRDREPPPYKGLSVLAKREINLQLIALAQYLYVHFNENDLSALARSTQIKPPGECNFGPRSECLEMERPIRDGIAKMKSDEKRTDKVNRRVNHLRENVSYKGNADAVPEPHTLSRIQLSLIGAEHMHTIIGEVAVNVVEQDYWGLAGLLLE